LNQHQNDGAGAPGRPSRSFERWMRQGFTVPWLMIAMVFVLGVVVVLNPERSSATWVIAAISFSYCAVASAVRIGYRRRDPLPRRTPSRHYVTKIVALGLLGSGVANYFINPSAYPGIILFLLVLDGTIIAIFFGLAELGHRHEKNN
jgi:hypothetical protein